MSTNAGNIVRSYDRRHTGDSPLSIGFRLEKETAEKLEDLCIREGCSRSALLKRLVRQYVEANHE